MTNRRNRREMSSLRLDVSVLSLLFCGLVVGVSMTHICTSAFGTEDVQQRNRNLTFCLVSFDFCWYFSYTFQGFSCQGYVLGDSRPIQTFFFVEKSAWSSTMKGDDPIAMKRVANLGGRFLKAEILVSDMWSASVMNLKLASTYR